jgi:hypothetical protein
VGELHTPETDQFDSLGNWISPYNAVHWNGQEWELKRILYQGGFWTIESIYAFGSNDIWFAAFVRWNGLDFIDLPIPGILIGHSIDKIWGISSNDLYVVGSGGLIAHYDGSSWQKLNSGTTLPIQDIWGAKNIKTGKYEIIAIASEKFQNNGKRVLKIENDQVVTLQDEGFHGV